MGSFGGLLVFFVTMGVTKVTTGTVLVSCTNQKKTMRTVPKDSNENSSQLPIDTIYLKIYYINYDNDNHFQLVEG
jgi:hypothetical protein